MIPLKNKENMAGLSNSVSKMSIGYFDDIQFIDAAVLPRCAAVIDGGFPEMCNLQFVLSGRMYYQVDEGPMTVIARPTVFWHHPRHTYRYGPETPGRTWHHHWVTFRGPRAMRLMERGFMPLAACGYVAVPSPLAFAEVFGRLVTLVRAHNPSLHPEAVGLLERLLAMLLENPSPQQDQSPRRFEIEALADRLRRRPPVQLDVEREARRLHVSTPHFRRLFRGVVGRPVHAYLLCCRMQAAAMELRNPLQQVKDVAIRFGYEDPAQFSKAFKKHIGIPPARFRQMALLAKG